MSYARFGWDDSDVYVFKDVRGGITCCACRLRPSSRPENLLGVEDFNAPDIAGMLEHLYEHIAHGHHVPHACIAELREDAASRAPHSESTER